ncbi:MAG: FKBP-type peptidyl-prolyl cis-trans isomerase [Oscillospiraceae bacterium]|nr:FKBP-type peptidyl-prolyl cis-trans isomerase [Oscillospiraceae bacterium]
MKINKKILCICAILALFAALLFGCGGKGDGNGEFDRNEAIEDNGFWKGIKALDYVELFNYKAMPIPNETHHVSDASVQSEIDAMLAEYSNPKHITDRAVKEGDKVNIDYVGSVGGVEFDGGSTIGAGTDVTAGSADYIDDFLTQIIGHMPGETMNVEVTFPENYGKEELNGKDALFVTTINYITEYEYPELTDDFVAENLSGEHGWKTVGELKDATRAKIQKNAIQQYIRRYIDNEVKVKSVPEELVEYQKNVMVRYYQDYADYYGMELEEFLVSWVGVFGGVEELLASNYESNYAEAKFDLVLQAIAEDSGLSIDDGELKDYFAAYVGTDDYSQYEEQYGRPSLIQFALYQKIVDYIVENAVLN